MAGRGAVKRITNFLTFKRFILYVFPIYLVLAEYAIRFLLSYAPGKEEDLAVVGSTSTVIAAGLSLIAPVLIPKPVALTPSAARFVSSNRIVVTGVGDQRLIWLAYLALLILPFAWGWALWLIHKGGADYDFTIWKLHVPGPFLVAVVIYLVGVVFTQVV